MSKLNLRCACEFHDMKIEIFENFIWIFIYKLNEKDRRRKRKLEADIVLKKEDVDKLIEFLKKRR
ncbi:MAG: hypothetical protein ACTSQG_06305 [Promethearchaeota archaeon]